MAKLGENTPHIIDATVDFMASSQAFREYLKNFPLITQYRQLLLMSTYRYIYEGWNTIVCFIDQSRQNHIEKTVNGSRNSFAGREALDKRSASVFRLFPVTGFSTSLSSSVTTF